MRTLIAIASCFAVHFVLFGEPLRGQSALTLPSPSKPDLGEHPTPGTPQPSPAPGIIPPPQAAPEPYWPPKTHLLELQDGKHPGDVSLYADRAPLSEVLKLIAGKHNLNLVAGPGVDGEVTLSIENAHLHEVLDALVGVAGHRWHRSGNLLYVTKMAGEQRLDASVQGRQLRVFSLNYVAATDVLPVAEGLLTPIGQAFVTSADATDKAKTNELLVVEDTPEVIQRIEMYLLQVDQPPRQVLIEVHILQVVLNDLLRHGVNLRPSAQLGTGSLTFETLGLANTEATQGLKLTLNGTDITSLVELIQTNANARTLASPKLLVANRQTSNIQIGKRLSYLTTTTTQTAAVQSVQFLETGVVVQVTPTISVDDQVLLQISPKVSGGQLNSATNLPEEESTELSTTVLLPDGGGVIMGGLIKDEDIENVVEIPGLCRLPVLGHLFRRREINHIRTEVIVAMVAHIIPSIEDVRQHELCELHNTLPPYAAVELRGPLQMSVDAGHQPNPHLSSIQLLPPRTPSDRADPRSPAPHSEQAFPSPGPVYNGASRRLPTVP